MSVTVEATYENGVLKPKQPLQLKESQTVYITIDEDPKGHPDRARETYGLVG